MLNADGSLNKCDGSKTKNKFKSTMTVFYDRVSDPSLDSNPCLGMRSA